MKLLSKSMLGLAALALMTGSASATQTLYICGSTAFRAPATAAIISYLTSNGGCWGATDKANPATASSLFGATHGIFVNASTVAAATIVVETNWTGSAAGLVDVTTANSTQDSFISTGQAVSIINTGSSEYGVGNTSPSTTAVVPNVTFCDSFDTSIASTIGTGTVSGTVAPGITTGAKLAAALQGSNVQYAGTSAGAGNQDAVGIIPFAWYVGNSSSSHAPDFTNMTQQAAAAIISGGIPTSLLSGSASDASNVAYLVGRNEDSGTRLCAFAEAQLGLNGPGCDQFELSFSGTSTTGKLTTSSGTVSTLPTGGVAATVTTAVDFEADAQLYTEPKIGWDSAGHSGYAAGGDVAAVLLAYNPVTGVSVDSVAAPKTYFVGYLGWSDGYGLTSPGNVAGVADGANGPSTGAPLTYNGVTASVANIENGLYTFWAYEHMYYLTSGTNAIGSNKSAADTIADLVFNTYAPANSSGVIESPLAEPATANGLGYAPPAGILYNSMQVNRGAEGEVVLPNL